jgi:hypothetical protein
MKNRLQRLLQNLLCLKAGESSMRTSNQEIDIAKNFKVTEWLKSELLSQVSVLYRAMIQTGEEAVLEALANVIVSAYLLGRRMGIGFSHIDSKVEAMVKANIDSQHEIEKWYGDFSNLFYYLRSKER